jgi:hypothetical protein
MAVCFVLGLLAVSSVVVESVTPTQKVIQLLGDMEAKAKKMKNAEEVEFAEFNQFCKDKQASSRQRHQRGCGADGITFGRYRETQE